MNKQTKNIETLNGLMVLNGFKNKFIGQSNVINNMQCFNLKYEVKSLKEYCELNNIAFSKDIVDIAINYLYARENIYAYSSLLNEYKNNMRDGESEFKRLNNYFVNIRNDKSNQSKIISPLKNILKNIAYKTKFKELKRFDEIYIEGVRNIKEYYRFWLLIDDKYWIYIDENKAKLSELSNLSYIDRQNGIEINEFEVDTDQFYKSTLDFDDLFKKININPNEHRILMMR